MRLPLEDCGPGVSLLVGQELCLEVLKPALGGEGLARYAGMAVFVPGALPGQRILAGVSSVKARHAKARLIQVLEQSPEFVPPACPHFHFCGGCDWLHMDYARQLFWKRELAQETLRHIAGMDVQVAETIASPLVSGYRNKMEFAFASQAVMQEGEPIRTMAVPGLALGLRPRGVANAVVPIRSCALCSKAMIDVLNLIGHWAAQTGLEAHDPESGRGFWRYVALRHAAEPDQLLVYLVTSDDPGASGIGPQLAADLRSRTEHVRCVVHAVTKGVGVRERGERIVSNIPVASNFTLGQDPATGSAMEECSGGLLYTVHDLALEIPPGSFFQVNTGAAELLYRVVREFAGLAGEEAIWDLYSGVGGAALVLADQSAKVTGYEENPEAVVAARENARRNRRPQCRFVAGDVLKTLPRVVHPHRGQRRSSKVGERPDVIVADPPRAGMRPEVSTRLLQIGAPRMILVSCNPATLARDVQRLRPGYDLLRVQPVDMFPHTSHIECVAELRRRDNVPSAKR